MKNSLLRILLITFCLVSFNEIMTAIPNSYVDSIGLASEGSSQKFFAEKGHKQDKNKSYNESMMKADELIKKAKLTSNQEERYEYIIKAEKLYKEVCEENPLDTDSLVALSKAYQMTKRRSDAKLYLLKAYNLHPENPKLQKEMGDFYFNFQEYTTALEYYKLALSSGLLRDFETNLQTAKCYEKLGDLNNAYLYFQISNRMNSQSRKVLNKLNEYESDKHQDNTEELEKAKYKYLFKDKPINEKEKNDSDASDIIEQINSNFI